jgi:hypothetical protein
MDMTSDDFWNVVQMEFGLIIKADCFKTWQSS